MLLLIRPSAPADSLTPLLTTETKEHLMNPAALKAALSGDIANVLAASTPGGIERQEAAGQRELCASSKLPKEIGGATREQLERIGFKFGADVDDLFVACTLPPGWKLSATEHSMHNDLLDDKGRRRAGIFYKAAFYDRKAHMHMGARFYVNGYGDGSAPDVSAVRAMDGDAVLKMFGEYRRDRDGYAHARVLESEAEAYLTERFPSWRDPLAHWE